MSYDNFTRGYLTCALWASTDENGNPLDDKYDIRDFDQSAIDKACADCKDFQEANAADMALYVERRDMQDRLSGTGDTWDDYAGHDFWLTRNGHGVGFWDRGLGELGDRLTKAAKTYGDADLYVGDDGKLHFS